MVRASMVSTSVSSATSNLQTMSAPFEEGAESHTASMWLPGSALTRIVVSGRQTFLTGQTGLTVRTGLTGQTGLICLICLICLTYLTGLTVADFWL